jgi:hypothetical protein
MAIITSMITSLQFSISKILYLYIRKFSFGFNERAVIDILFGGWQTVPKLCREIFEKIRL